MNRREFVKEMAVGAIAATTVTVSDMPAPAAPSAPDSDWPTYRRDPALTATSPLKGGLKRAPRIVWSVNLGGPNVPSEQILVKDVNGDGRDEFLALGAETVVCRDGRGHLLWKLEAVPNPRVLDVRDYVGDGSAGILLTTTVAGRDETFMVSGRTGKSVRLWRDENNFGGHLRYGKLLPHVAGAQIASTSSGQTPPAPWSGCVRLVSFEKGLEKPHFHVRLTLPGALYSPLMLFADMDADGRDEMVVISHEQIWTFDTETGRQKFYAAYSPQIRTYSATIAAVRLRPDDPTPSLVMVNPHIPGLKVVRQDGKTAAAPLSESGGGREGGSVPGRGQDRSGRPRHRLRPGWRRAL